MTTDLTQLRMYCVSFDDTQKYRIRFENRLRAYPDAMGVMPELLASVKRMEDDLSKEIKRTLRNVVPAEVLAWQKRSHGIGEHLLGLLIGTTGDPHLAIPRTWDGEAGDPYERSVASFRAYCGWGNPTLKRRKGMDADDAKAMGNQQAKKVVWLLATGAIKEPGRKIDEGLDPDACRWVYRKVYEAARLKYADKQDADGNDWSDGHKHNAAIRAVAKQILLDLWCAWPHASVWQQEVAA